MEKSLFEKLQCSLKRKINLAHPLGYFCKYEWSVWLCINLQNVFDQKICSAEET